MNKEQILAALVPVYNAAYDEYFRLSELSTQLLHEEENKAYRVIARKAVQKSHYMDGMKDAVKVLGIGEEEFMAAVNADKKGVDPHE